MKPKKYMKHKPEKLQYADLLALALDSLLAGVLMWALFFAFAF
jgi:hypothetical protein